MSEWIPLFQSLLWPAVVVIGVLLFRPVIKRVLAAVATRIEQGDPFEAGTSGVKLGSGQQSKSGEHGEEQLLKKDELPHELYLVHSKKRAKDLDTDEYEYHRLRIWVDADEPEMLRDLASVTYHLHPTFRDPIKIISDAKQKFLLATTCWGEFNMYAEIHFKTGRPPLRVERYIDL